jgi:hypothetical protein
MEELRLDSLKPPREAIDSEAVAYTRSQFSST